MLAYHNAHAPPTMQIAHTSVPKPDHHSPEMQTTAYTAMIEIAPNRVFLVYDRTPYGWSPIPAGERGQIFLLELEIARA